MNNQGKMQTRFQIYTDEMGNKSSVIVPYAEWTKLTGKLKTLENKLKVFSGIRDGVREVKEAGRSGRKLQSLSDFVDESRS